MGKHWRLAPSSSGRWLKCPYSAQNLPEIPSKAAQRGSWLHRVVEYYLLHGVPIFGRNKDERHARYCAEYAERVKSPDKLYEQVIESAVVPEHGGTVDVILAGDESIHVVDFKFGKWPVYVENNTQIGCYLNLARQVFPGRKRFFGTILQPQVYNEPQTAEFSGEWLDSLERRAGEAAFSDAKVAGDHCQFCPLRKGCVAYEARSDLYERYGYPWR